MPWIYMEDGRYYNYIMTNNRSVLISGGNDPPVNYCWLYDIITWQAVQKASMQDPRCVHGMCRDTDG